MMKTSNEILKEIEALSDIQAPMEIRRKVNDSSIEKLVDLMQNNAPRGLTIHRDELVALFKKMEKPGHESDRAFLMEGWKGDGSHVDDRIGRGTVRTDNLCLSLIGTIQPGRIVSYLKQALSEDSNDGFPQRLQLAVYPDIPPFKYVDRWPDIEAKNRVYSIVKALAEDDFTGEGFENEED